MSKRITRWCMAFGLAGIMATSAAFAQDVTANVTATPTTTPPAVTTGAVVDPGTTAVVVDPGANPVVDPTGWGGTTVTTPPKTNTPPVTTGTITPPKNPVATSAQKQTILTKAEIRTLLADGKYLEAEKAYHTWAAYWFEEDSRLLAQIEQSVLIQQYRDGDFKALLALTEAGDPQAKGLLQGVLLNDPITQGSLTDDAKKLATPAHIQDLVAAVNLSRLTGDKSLLNALMLVAKSNNTPLVNNAIEAVGDLGDTRVIPDLLKLLDTANTEQTVYLARALDKLGAGNAVVTRFTAQLRFPEAATRTRASLALGAVGDMAGGINIFQLLAKKDPIAIIALGGLKSETSQAYILEALNGSEAEQLAAMKSLGVVGDSAQVKLQQQMLLLLRNVTMPDSVRIAAIKWCAEQTKLNSSLNIPSTIWSVALSDDKSQPDSVRAAAISASVKLGMLSSQTRRNLQRPIAYGVNDTLATAARESFLYYATHPGIKK
ncbi:MAG: hypothetical protein WCJ56_13955 [bacterium]